MGWKNNPEIRDLSEYADKHQYKAVIALCIMEDGKFSVNSYGKTNRLCNAAKKINEQLYQDVTTGEIEIPDELM